MIYKEVIFRDRKFFVSECGTIRTSMERNPRKFFKNSSGYSSFSKGNQIFLVHRIVALAWIDNPENKKFVNHKNGIKSDNSVQNLEWVTKSENEIHSTRVLGNKRNIEGLRAYWGNPAHQKKVDIYDLNLNFIKTFDSCKKCAEYLGITQSSLNNHLHGRTFKTGNHIVKYNETNKEKKDVNCISRN